MIQALRELSTSLLWENVQESFQVASPFSLHKHTKYVHVRVSSRKLYQGGSSVIIMKGGHDQMKSRCGFYSKLEYCEGVVEEFGGKLES